MEQQEIADALATYVKDGDDAGWRKVIDGIREGTILVAYGRRQITLRAVPRPALLHFARRLQSLRAESDMTQLRLAGVIETAPATVTRYLNGQSLGPWPVVQMMITTMGGDPADFRDDYVAARAEVRPHFKMPPG